MMKGTLKSVMEIAQEIMQHCPTKLCYDSSCEEYYLDVYYINDNMTSKAAMQKRIDAYKKLLSDN